MRKFSTSLYIAPVKDEKFPNLHNLRIAIFEFIKRKEKELNDMNFAIYENDNIISFYEPGVGRVQIKYRVNPKPKDKFMLLSFYPVSSKDGYSKDPKYWKRQHNIDIVKKVLKFSDILGNTLEIPVEEYGAVEFKRIFYEEYTDISKWNALLFERARLSLEKIPKSRRIIEEYLLKKSREDQYLFVVFSSIPFSSEIDSEAKESGNQAIYTLKNELKRFGRVVGPYNSLNFKYTLAKYPKNRKVVAIFVENEEIISKVYKNFKRYLDIQQIPSQFISTSTINEKFKFPTVKLNFLLEIFSKIGEEKPLSLEPIPALSTIDGVLCLSDIKDASKTMKQKLFGALFMYTLSHSYEEIHIYEDINYKVEKGRLSFEPEALSRLVNHVYELGGPESFKIDIFLTRPWAREDIQRFAEELSKTGYKINKIYYISTMRARFVDETIVNNYLKDEFGLQVSEYWHFYNILSKDVAIIRTSTKLRIYPTLFSIYVELMWPETASLSKEDIEKIVWFTKKRLYRFQEFFVTKVPEPIWIFRNLRKIYLGEITETVRIPLRLMI